MVWSWSHSQEAYANAERNLQALPEDVVRTIWAEWQAAGEYDASEGEPSFSQRKYDAALRKARTLPVDILSADIWDKASQQATCDNGGFVAHMCPWGCGPHCVSFDAPELVQGEES